MITDITVNATRREGTGKGFNRRLRSKGMIPVAIYGEGKDPVIMAVNSKEIATILRSETGHNTIFTLAMPSDNGGESATVIIKDWQVDPVKGRLLHADLMRLSLTSVTQVSVPVEPIGEPIGVKMDGGILDIQLREVEVECLPGDIPERIEVDVADLRVGDHVTVADLKYDREKVRVLTDEAQIVAGVLASRLAEEAAPTPAEAAGAASEPEVIKKGKAEEE